MISPRRRSVIVHLGLARSHPNEAKRTFDTPTTSIQLQPPSSPNITQPLPAHPITPSPPSLHHPSSITHHPSPIAHLPSLTQPQTLSPPLVLLFRRSHNQHCQLQSYPVRCSPAYSPTSEPEQLGLVISPSLATTARQLKVQLPLRYLAGPVYLEARTFDSPVASFVV